MLQHTDLSKTPAQPYLTYLLLAFIAMTGLSYINFQPGLVNALAGGIGFSEVEAGQIVALNGYGGLLGSYIAIFLVRRIRWQPTLFICLALLTGMDLATTWLDQIHWMLGWRFCAGTLGGLALGLVVAQLAKLDNPDRAFGTLLFVQFSIGALVMMFLPALEAMLSAYAVFQVMAGLSLLSLLFMLLLPPQPLPCMMPQTTAETANPKQADHSRPDGSRSAILLLFAIAAYQMAASAIWAYVGLIGLDAAISDDKVNSYIVSTGLLGLLGAMLPMLSGRHFGRHFGRLPWLTAGVVLSITAAILLNFAAQHLFYMLAMALLFFAWPALQSYLMVATADFDRSGRLSTIATLVASVGLATGPLMASMLLEQNNFSRMLYCCAVIFGLSYLLLLQPVLAQEKPIQPKGDNHPARPDHSRI
jgi:predicted MFS family arabinose efflux permease